MCIWSSTWLSSWKQRLECKRKLHCQWGSSSILALRISLHFAATFLTILLLWRVCRRCRRWKRERTSASTIASSASSSHSIFELLPALPEESACTKARLQIHRYFVWNSLSWSRMKRRWVISRGHQMMLFLGKTLTHALVVLVLRDISTRYGSGRDFTPVTKANDRSEAITTA